MRTTVALTTSQRFLLDQISEEDFSAHDECRGPDFDRLVDLGLVWIVHATSNEGYASVELTQAAKLLRDVALCFGDDGGWWEAVADHAAVGGLTSEIIRKNLIWDVAQLAGVTLRRED